MHTAHKITIEWGMLNVPVRLGVTIPSSSRSMFHQVHVACGSQIEQKRWCPSCQAEIDYSQVGKGVTVPGSDMLVLVSKEEIEALQDWEAGVFRILSFCPAGQVERLLYGSVYRVSPGHDAKGKPSAMRACALLRDVLVAAGVVAIGRYGNSLTQLEVRDGEFLLTKLAWPAVLKPADADTVIDPAAVPRPQELKMALSLVKQMTADFRPEDHVDTYGQGIDQLASNKAQGIAPEPAAAGTAAVYGDMMAVLQQSIDQVKAQRAAKTTTARAPRARRKAS